MTRNRRDIVHKINCLSNELDTLYHQAAKKLGIADSVLMVAYMIHEKGDGCLLYEICTESCISKQTINSAIRKLEGDGILYLEQDKGRRKRVWLTENGKHFVQQTATRLLEAECSAFADWSDEEFDDYLRLMEKYNHAFRKEIDKLDCLSYPSDFKPL